MRVIENSQLTFGEVNIKDIEFNSKSRDDIDQLLKGIQALYCNIETRSKLFEILKKMIPANVSANTGRPGMELWRVFVLSILRLNLNWDYDRLVHMANNHSLIRKMLGHSDWINGEFHYEVQTLKDNFALLTPEILDEINILVIDFGHSLVKKKETNEQGEISLKCRGDSFVVETNVHFPTDINLLYDAMRKSIKLTGQLFEEYKLSDWRQYEYQVELIKKLYRNAQNSKRTRGETAALQIQTSHKKYIESSNIMLQRIKTSLEELQTAKPSNLDIEIKVKPIHDFIDHATRQINQIERRVLQGETIPHDEKVFSLFQPHTEWISKGKAGVPVELGVKVGIIEDQYQFILHHKVMQNEEDVETAVPMAQVVKEKYPGFNALSYDRGYYSSKNRDDLNDLLEHVSLPKKGKISNKDKVTQSSESYIYAKGKHSAVESAINALEVHGLDKCLDHGVIGFTRYVAVAITARNIQRVGAIIHQRDQALFLKRERRKRFLEAA